MPQPEPFGYVACQAAYDPGGPLKALLAIGRNRRFVQVEFIVRELPQLHAVALEGTAVGGLPGAGIGAGCFGGA